MLRPAQDIKAKLLTPGELCRLGRDPAYNDSDRRSVPLTSLPHSRESNHTRNAISAANAPTTRAHCTRNGKMLRRTELMTAPQWGQT